MGHSWGGLLAMQYAVDHQKNLIGLIHLDSAPADYKGKRVIVLSHTLKDVREEAELFCGQLTDLLSKLYSENVSHIWVDGGVTASKFLEAGLVDEMTISIIAMVLGSGISLFSSMNQEQKCRLISTQSYPSGLVQLKYEVANDGWRIAFDHWGNGYATEGAKAVLAYGFKTLNLDEMCLLRLYKICIRDVSWKR